MSDPNHCCCDALVKFRDWLVRPFFCDTVKKGPKPASAATLAANAEVKVQLDFSNKQDFEDATRGLIAALPNNGVITNDSGQRVWDLTKFSFVDKPEQAPDTVNPSLWRQSCLVMYNGLFKVTERLYQVRNADLSNMTIYEGETGIIVADPLISAETAKAALELYYTYRPRTPVKAVIYSHSHVDHYGGVKGVVTEEDVKAGKAEIIAPVGFMEHATSENLYAGTIMNRRALFMYGNVLPRSPSQCVGAGLGLTCSVGLGTLISPTVNIKPTDDLAQNTVITRVIDGLTFEFMLAPDTEAPAEMHWFVKELKALTAAENCVHTLHNTYTLRGAKIRDPLAWSKCLDDTLTRWGDEAEVLYGMHHWPVWGEAVRENLSLGRDAYRFINDQTLRLANLGYGPDDIANMLVFPEKIRKCWALRGYYGTLYHNVKATYVRYLGWFNGNPALLHVLPPVEAAKNYVAYMGGAETVLRKAKEDYDKGNYQWVAEVASRVVFADPSNQAACELEADALEQMGYQAESAPWRNFYLSGAQELREGVHLVPHQDNADMIHAISTASFLDYVAIRLNAVKAGTIKMVLNLVFPDTLEDDKIHLLTLTNGALNHRATSHKAGVSDATLTFTNNSTGVQGTDVFKAVASGKMKEEDAIQAGVLVVEGDPKALPQLLSVLDEFTGDFPLLKPLDIQLASK